MEIFLMKSFVIALVMLTLVMSGTAFAAAPKDKPDKKGILVVAFGTSMPDAKKAIDNLVDSAKKAFPDTEVRLAYTSNIIRRKIAKEQNVNIPTPTSALAQMNDEGFTHVYVMPMHIIPGEEYDDIAGLVNGVAAVKGKYEFKELKLGRPYLSSAADCDLMADILMKRFAKDLAKKGTVIVLMGHGTPHHAANAMYSQLQLSLDKKAPGRFALGTVEAAPMIEDVIARLKRDKGVKTLVISPLMIVAGDHANNDLADKDDPESWYSQLKVAGYKDIKTFLVGLGEDADMARVYVSKIKDMMK
ncbi:sirohydrochlorin cobaltochelatase [Cloacibacillus sp.]|uniref:sirohydrochlorin cobaltochelatase n=1 Tax=Cloacibacillus sp. TaxID=2049023 RepID=UPI0025C31D63|nr:sirohydrochlorin cobaltochelatase [Cloacibacillus sp.]